MAVEDSKVVVAVPRPRRVADDLSKIPQVDYVVITSGRFDVLVELVCGDTDELLSIVNDTIRRTDGVRSTETFTYLSLQKQTYSWGTR